MARQSSALRDDSPLGESSSPSIIPAAKPKASSSQKTVSELDRVIHERIRLGVVSALAVNPVIISTIAEVTFFGRDQTGHEVSVTGRITVNFGNFAD